MSTTGPVCPVPHPVWSGQTHAEGLEVLGGHATDSCVRCTRCGRVFWTVCDLGGKYEYQGEREVDAALAERAVVQHEPAALAELFVNNGLPYGPLWDLTLALVEIFRAMTPGANDAERARALRDAGGAGGRWTAAIRALETTARAAMHGVPEATFPVDLRLTGHAVREWHEVGDSLVLLTDHHEMLRLEGRGVTRLDLAGRPRWLATGHERLMLGVDDAAIVVIDAAGWVSTWDSKGEFHVEALDGGWWLRVPATNEAVRVIELRKPDGRPCVGFKRSFAPDSSWMPPPRRMGEGWVLSNLIDDEGAMQALSLVDAKWKLVAQSGACPRADRRVTVIDDTRLLAEIDGAVERWVRKGAALELVETIPCRSSWWIKDRLVTTGTDGVVTARNEDGVVWWTWSRQPVGAPYGVVGIDGLLLYDNEHAHWLSFSGELRHTFEVESPSAHAGREGTIYVKSLADLWVLSGAEAHLVAVDMALHFETMCGDDILLRDDHGRCLLVDRDRKAIRFEAPGAHLPVTGTRGGPWLVEGEHVRGAFEKNAHTMAEALAMHVGGTSRGLSDPQRRHTSVVVLPDGRVPYLLECTHPGFIDITFAGGGAWHIHRWDDATALVAKAGAALKGWLDTSPKTVPTLYEIALSVVDLLAATFEERWNVSVPGTPDPREMWLRGPNAAEAAVGVFAGRVNVAFVETVPVATRGDLVLRRDAIVAAVREQKARHAKHAAISGTLRELASSLAARLSERLGVTFEVACWRDASYESPVEPRLMRRDDPHRTRVWVTARDGVVHVHGGLPGAAGWDATGTDVDAMIDPLAVALEGMDEHFRVDRRNEGRRFRVRRTKNPRFAEFEKLGEGEVVTFLGLDDIDNHYGELVFVRADGSEIRFGGDYSSPDDGWAAELYLVFEPL